MEEVLKFLQEGIDKEEELKEHNRELNFLGVMSDEEFERLDSMHDYTINKIKKIHIKVINKYNDEV